MIDLNLGGPIFDVGNIGPDVPSDARGIGIRTTDSRLVYVLGLSQPELRLLGPHYQQPAMLRIWTPSKPEAAHTEAIEWQLRAMTPAQREACFAQVRSVFCLTCGRERRDCPVEHDE